MSKNVVNKVVRSVERKLTREEVAGLGEEMAQLNKQMHDLEFEADSVKKSYKTRIESKQEAIDSISVTTRRGTVWEDTDCIETMDFKKGRVITVRIDTDEIVENREMTEAERQLSIETEA